MLKKDKKKKKFEDRRRSHIVEISAGKWLKNNSICVQTTTLNLSLIGKTKELITVFKN